MLLQPSEKTFSADVENIGSFTFKYPRVMDELAIDAKAADLLDGNKNPSVYANNIAYEMATLSFVTVKAPEGWNLEKIYNYKELDAVYQVYLQRVLQFRGENKKAPAPESSTES